MARKNDKTDVLEKEMPIIKCRTELFPFRGNATGFYRMIFPVAGPNFHPLKMNYETIQCNPKRLFFWLTTLVARWLAVCQRPAP